jgi:quinolinate synthase
MALRLPCAGARPAAAARPVRAAPPARRPRAAAARAAAAPAAAPPAAPSPTPEFSRLAARLAAAPDAAARLRELADLARSAPAPPAGLRADANRVLGCAAQVWLAAELLPDGALALHVDSDSELSRGLGQLLARGLAGLSPEAVAAVEPAALGAFGLGDATLVKSRANGLLNMLEAARRRARAARGALPAFPSLRVTAAGTEARGTFARAQDAYMRPDPAAVDALVEALSSKKIGVVAHFYMDPEVQGVLCAAAARWPHVRISDSLVMADGAAAMAAAGCEAIAVLGVDFMSENVRAILDEAGHADVPVYRMAAAEIGCSLAEAAESDAYGAYLAEASATPNSLHVVYINTSLRTKALAHAAVPTVTCTSSNVVQTVLAAFAQVPEGHVWYGPDTYMGDNLAALLTSLAAAPAEEVAALHAAHTPASVAAALPRLHTFREGACVVHHLFGGEVCQLVADAYSDAYLAAHFEVPGEMFALAMAARARGMGVVGSTQNILDFVAARLAEALAKPHAETLRVVLGTEAGMATAVVLKVQAMLREAGRDDVAVEIIFPVSPDAIATDAQAGSQLGGAAATAAGLTVLPGPAGGEGCSLEGGCASCPYMKMNSLAALMRVAGLVGDPAGEALLGAQAPRAYAERVGGRTMAQAGCVPILHMRGFQRGGQLPEELVADVRARHA